jgi:hypothetical protein
MTKSEVNVARCVLRALAHAKNERAAECEKLMGKLLAAFEYIALENEKCLLKVEAESLNKTAELLTANE